MPYILFAVFLLLLAWIGFIATAIGKLSERKKSMVNPLEAYSPPSPKGRREENKKERRK